MLILFHLPFNGCKPLCYLAALAWLVGYGLPATDQRRSVKAPGFECCVQDNSVTSSMSGQEVDHGVFKWRLIKE